MKKSFSVDFKENFQFGGFNEVAFCGQDPKFSFNNEPCVVLDKETFRIRFKLNDADRSDTYKGTEYSLSVTYFDGPQGFLRICYSSIFLPDAILGTIYTKGTNEWKTQKFIIKDALFNADCYDFEIMTCETDWDASFKSESPIAIKNVTLTQEKKNPIFASASISETGNTFSWYKNSKIINIKHSLLKKLPFNAVAEYKVIDYSGNTVFTQNEELIFNESTELKTKLNLGKIKFCDTYKLIVTITGKGFKTNYELLDFAVIKTDKNGALNREVLINAHFQWYGSKKVTKEGIDMLRKANIGGARLELGWNNFELEPNNFDWSKSSEKDFYDELKANNMDVLALLCRMPTHYEAVRSFTIPETEKQIEGYKKYIEFMLKEIGDYTRYYEIWNEPNMTTFNYRRAPGDVYMAITKIAADLIHKANKDNEVCAFGMTYLGLKKSDISKRLPKVYYTECLDSGLCDCVDAIAIHPYGGIDSLEKRVMENIVGWYRDEFKAKYNKTLPMWNTELGYSASQLDSEDRKGFYNSRSCIYLKSRDLATFNCFYNFEKKGTIDYDREFQFGMVSGVKHRKLHKGKLFIPTRSFLILAGHNYCMANANTLGIYDADDDNVRLTLFNSRKFNKNILACNTVIADKKVTLSLNTETLTCFDAFGNEKKLKSKNGIYNLKLTEYPIYLLGDIEDVNVIKIK